MAKGNDGIEDGKERMEGEKENGRGKERMEEEKGGSKRKEGEDGKR